jgi:hypothetical protein
MLGEGVYHRSADSVLEGFLLDLVVASTKMYIEFYFCILPVNYNTHFIYTGPRINCQICQNATIRKEHQHITQLFPVMTHNFNEDESSGIQRRVVSLE